MWQVGGEALFDDGDHRVTGGYRINDGFDSIGGVIERALQRERVLGLGHCRSNASRCIGGAFNAAGAAFGLASASH